MLQTKMSARRIKGNKICRENHQEVACAAEIKTTTLEINIQKKGWAWRKTAKNEWAEEDAEKIFIAFYNNKR